MNGASHHFPSMTPGRTTEEKERNFEKRTRKRKENKNEDVKMNSMKSNYLSSKKFLMIKTKDDDLECVRHVVLAGNGTDKRSYELSAAVANFRLR
jgi:hypothetical protein